MYRQRVLQSRIKNWRLLLNLLNSDKILESVYTYSRRDSFVMADRWTKTSEARRADRAPATARLSVMDRLREAILGGAVGAGERLNEVQLSKTLSVSRTPVRAALQALAGEGLLDYAPNRGFTVREFPLPAIVDAYDIRAALEGVAVRFAAERGLPATGTRDHRARARRRRQTARTRLVRGRRSHDLSRHQRRFSRRAARGRRQPHARAK